MQPGLWSDPAAGWIYGRRRMRGGANLFLLLFCLWSWGAQFCIRFALAFSRYFCVEAFLIMTCINMEGFPHVLLSLQRDTGSHSPAWGFILNEAWMPRSSPKPICKCLPFFGQPHKDWSESASYIVPECAAYVLLLSASRVHRKLGSFGFTICQTKRFVGNYIKLFPPFCFSLCPWNVFVLKSQLLHFFFL